MRQGEILIFSWHIAAPYHTVTPAGMVNWSSWDPGKVILTVWGTPRVRPRTTWGPSPPSSAPSPRTEWARWEVYPTSRLRISSRLSLARRDCSAIRWTLGQTSFIIILMIIMIFKVIMFMKLLVIVRILKIQLYEIHFGLLTIELSNDSSLMIILQPREHGFIFFIKFRKIWKLNKGTTQNVRDLFWKKT